MQLQQLTIHNLASIEDATIPFDTPPLADSEVFLITGKTGSGKSTLLDAICLALYADTPRLKNTMMQGRVTDIENNEVGIDNPCQLMRRNTGEAFVKLTFIGNNGTHYEATWTAQRARKKATGKLQNRQWQIHNLDTDHILTKKDEVEAVIHDAVGLDFNQFCRTSLLAQGEFTRFLNSKDEEKAAILEKITGMDIYSKIGAKIYAITDQKRQNWEKAKRLIEEIPTLTTEELLTKEKAIQEMDQQYKQLAEFIQLETRKLTWLNKNTSLENQFAEAKKKYEDAKAKITSEAFREKDTLVKEWHTTTEARNCLTNINTATQQQTEQRQTLQALALQYKDLQGGLLFAQQELSRQKDQTDQLETLIAIDQPKVSVYQQAQTIAEYLKRIHTGRNTLQTLTKSLNQTTHTLTNTLQPTCQKLAKEATEAREAFAQEEQRVNQQTADIEALHLQELRRQQTLYTNLLNAITIANERLAFLEKAKADLATQQQQLRQRFDALTKKKDESAQMDKPINKARVRMETKKECLDKQKDTIDKFAQTLRTQLHIGDICPVCRQTIQAALPHEEDLSLLVSELKKTFDEAEQTYQNLLQQKKNIDTFIQVETNALNNEVRAIQTNRSVETAEEKAKDACQACGLTTFDSETKNQLNQMALTTNTSLNRLKQQLTQGEEKELSIQKARTNLEKLRKKKDQAADLLAQTEKEISLFQEQIQFAKRQKEEKEADIQMAETTIQPILDSVPWEINWRTSPIEFAEALNQAAQQYNERCQLRQSLINQQETSKNNVQNVELSMTSIQRIIPAWTTITASAAISLPNLFARAKEMEQKVTITHSQLEQTEQLILHNQQVLNTFLQANPSTTVQRLHTLNGYGLSQIETIKASLENDHNQVTVSQTLMDDAQQQIARHQTDKPALQETDTLPQLTEYITATNAQLKTLSEAKGAIQETIRINNENLARQGTLRDDVLRQENDYQKWAQINLLIGDATGNKFRKIAQSYILTSLIHSANEYMRTLTGRYTLKVEPGTFVILLEDAYQGFATRAASTISGGESFLVSLSLALALSDIGQTLSVDTLFIDEGFGTLSGEPLQNAIITLRQLHRHAGRHVGIISHVEELQEQIPTQIRVIQESKSSSSTIEIWSQNT